MYTFTTAKNLLLKTLFDQIEVYGQYFAPEVLQKYLDVLLQAYPYLLPSKKSRVALRLEGFFSPINVSIIFPSETRGVPDIMLGLRNLETEPILMLGIMQFGPYARLSYVNTPVDTMIGLLISQPPTKEYLETLLQNPRLLANLELLQLPVAPPIEILEKIRVEPPSHLETAVAWTNIFYNILRGIYDRVRVPFLLLAPIYKKIRNVWTPDFESDQLTAIWNIVRDIAERYSQDTPLLLYTALIPIEGTSKIGFVLRPLSETNRVIVPLVYYVEEKRGEARPYFCELTPSEIKERIREIVETVETLPQLRNEVRTLLTWVRTKLRPIGNIEKRELTEEEREFLKEITNLWNK